MVIPSEWEGPPVEWAGLPVSPTLPYLRVSKVCLMRPGKGASVLRMERRQEQNARRGHETMWRNASNCEQLDVRDVGMTLVHGMVA